MGPRPQRKDGPAEEMTYQSLSQEMKQAAGADMMAMAPAPEKGKAAPTFLPIIGALVALVFLLPINRTGEVYRTAIYLLVGGLVLWGVNFLVTRSTGTVVAEEDLTTSPEDDRP